MAVRNLDESNTLFAIEVDMENRSPEEIAKDAVLQINALFDRLIKENQENGTTMSRRRMRYIFLGILQFPEAERRTIF